MKKTVSGPPRITKSTRELEIEKDHFERKTLAIRVQLQRLREKEAAHQKETSAAQMILAGENIMLASLQEENSRLKVLVNARAAVRKQLEEE